MRVFAAKLVTLDGESQAEGLSGVKLAPAIFELRRTGF
jgi:hypothetical protein